MAVIRLTSPKLDTDTAAVLRRISDIEVKLKNGVFKPSPESLESDFCRERISGEAKRAERSANTAG